MNNKKHDEVTFEEKFNDYGEYDNNTDDEYKLSEVDSAPNYEYEYEDDNEEKKEVVKKTTAIMLLIILIVIIILLLLKACSGTGVKEGGKQSLEEKFLNAGKNYFSVLNTELPDTKGTCTTVSLDILMQLEYLGSEFDVCDKDSTYLKACMLDDASIQYTPFMKCGTENTSFGNWKIGVKEDLTEDKSDVRFEYLAQYLNTEKATYGDVEEFWKEEIPYDNYKTVGTTNYYRYRDKEYIWTLRKRNYYPGDYLNASDEDTYYTASPANEYVNKTGKTTGYRWYKITNKQYYPVDDGYSTKEPSGYPYHDEKEDVTYTFYYTWNTVSAPSVAPQKFYACINENDPKHIYYSYYECSLNDNPHYNEGYTITKGIRYTCNGGKTWVDQTATCPTCPEGYFLNSDGTSCGKWSDPSTTACNTNLSTCMSTKVTVYRWYKGDKTYIGNESPTGMLPYYVSAPESSAIKDTSTKATVYKWYKLVETGTTDEYSSSSPSQDAVKTNKYKWGDWTKYSTTKPKSISGSREIQKKVKVKLKRIVGTSSQSYIKVSDDYLAEEDLIRALNKLGYEVSTINDVSSIGEIKLTNRMYYRDRI